MKKNLIILGMICLAVKIQAQVTEVTNTISSGSYLGTSNTEPVVFKQNNVFSGLLSAGITSFGYDSMQFDHAGSTAFGVNALHSNLANGGGFNSAFGTYALASNTSGAGNTAIGYQSNTKAIIGNQNTALGYQSLFNSLSSYNTAIGFRTLYSNTNGTGNTAVGINAMRDGITGSNNTAIGDSALLKATGNGNVGIGAGNLLDTGNYNILIGNESAKILSTGTRNTFVGFYSGGDSVSSIANSFFGPSSGKGITTGSYNTFLGSVVVPSATAATATSAGNDTSRTIILADGDSSQRLYIHSNGFTGIGLGNNVIPKNTLEIKALAGSPSVSGLRLVGLPNTSASITNATNKVLSVNATGDVILVDDKQGGTGSGGVTSNVLTSAVNTMTSNVNGLVATAPIVNSVANTITTGQLTTTINGVASTPVALPTFTEVDGSVTNELQTLTETPAQTTGTAITLSNGGGTVYVDGSETKIQAGTNVTVSGNGTIATPYIINSTATGNGISDNIYTANGTLLANRVVTMGNNNLIFNTTGNTSTTGGRVYIGNTTAFTTANFPTTTGDYRLNVEGGVLTEKVKVALRSTANWADYVFTNDYKLMPLTEVESFVKSNKHLPGVSSAENLVKEGLDLGEMQATQMQKIEELTLYAIEQNKKIENQDKEIEELKVLVKALVNKNK
ncbi:MAG: hypothetical protein ABI549_05180 [Flavobacterium sp.]|uniref:hypothetical protein n=1 Tax=Flavobacterium sp. TaxID=239 RepID=UPI0032631F06